MATRIEIKTLVDDARTAPLLEVPGVVSARIIDIYTIDGGLARADIDTVLGCLADPIVQHASVGDLASVGDEAFDWAIEVGFLPGVTDNAGNTAAKIIEDRLSLAPHSGADVYSSTLYLISGELKEADAARLRDTLFNPLIQRAELKSRAQAELDGGIGAKSPRVSLSSETLVLDVNLNVDDTALRALGKLGVQGPDGTRRGPLGLDLASLTAIRDHFNGLGRSPTDVEIETLAQTWSEHCKHTIFSSPIDEIDEGLYRRYIKGATAEVRAARGASDICVSVFSDNAGAIVFDSDWVVCDKVETHNTPSALDPFGGAMTGVLGVNRDCIGFGLGAKPILNRYAFCLADPRQDAPLYRREEKRDPMLSPASIMRGVIEGVEAGGNRSGVPTPQGELYFHPDYRGKPLVFCGTVGLIPRTIAGRPSHAKRARPGDLIIMAGGRVGKDGIHGATFSSEELDEGSPVTAVQIGDAFTQKKLSDAIIKEARALGLYTSITDNGAGGLSSSVGEMAQEAGGAHVDLDAAPLKYPGLQPWEIWISESQERMTLAVPPQHEDTLLELLRRRGVGAWVIGHFTDSGNLVATSRGETVLELDLSFLHEGQPKQRLETIYAPPTSTATPSFNQRSIAHDLVSMLSRLNICSREPLARLYDHEVQGGSVLKPLHGPGRVSSGATATRPLLDRVRAILTSQAAFPQYGEHSPYRMASAAIDLAARHVVAAGGSLDHLALLDNFCWCSSDDPYRLGQLKEAARACYDTAIALGLPFISGKDSMFNDFRGFDADGSSVKISAPPTLLISALGVLGDHRRVVSLDAKRPGDLIYLIGATRREFAGSEYLAMLDEQGGTAPRTDAMATLGACHALRRLTEVFGVASAIAVGAGGLGVSLAKTAIGGRLGLRVDLDAIPVEGDDLSDLDRLFAESTGRFLVTIAPDKAELFEHEMGALLVGCLGVVTEDRTLTIMRSDQEIANVGVDEMEASYRAPLSVMRL